MSVTSRNPPKRAASRKADDYVATCSGSEVARQSRVQELRRLVASGQYRVEPRMLAKSILSRSLFLKQG